MANKDKTKIVVQLTSGGLRLGGICFLVLLVLKLTGQINLSWLWVFGSLLLGPVIIVTLVVAILGTIAIIMLAIFAVFSRLGRQVINVRKKYIHFNCQKYSTKRKSRRH